VNTAGFVESRSRDDPSFDGRRLARFHARRAPWGSVLVAAVAGGVIVILRAIYSDSAREVLPFARLSAILLAAASAGALEDPCVAITSTTSLRRSASAWFSVSLTGAVAMIAWLLPVLGARQIAGDPSGLPIGGVVVEFLALLIAGWLLTQMISGRRGPSGAGTLAGASLTLAVIMSLMTPYTIDWLWRGPDPDWRVIHVRWATIGASAAGLLAVGLRDAAASRPLSRRVRARSSGNISFSSGSSHAVPDPGERDEF
jgi:hypothetical protein